MRHAFEDLVAIMAKLRAADGCPWDREQTHASLAPYLIEESHEVLDAISRGDPAALRAELGDVLLQVVFHAQMAREAGTFDADDVVDGLTRKLLHRHPHVFGDLRLGTAHEVRANWNEIKRRENPDRPALDSIPASLPALAQAQRVLGRTIPDEARRRDVEKTAAAVRERLEPTLAVTASQGNGLRAQVQAVISKLLFAVAVLAAAAGGCGRGTA